MASKRTKRVYRLVYRGIGNLETPGLESEDFDQLDRYLGDLLPLLPTASIFEAWMETREITVTDWVPVSPVPVAVAAEEPVDGDPGNE